MTAPYTAPAIRAITQAARCEHDFAGWLAQVLAAAAGQLGGADELTIGRPGSWEASHVEELVKGTVGWDDKYLPGPAKGRKLTDAKARQIKEACAWSGMTHRQIAAEFGVSPSTVSDIATGRTWGWLESCAALMVTRSLPAARRHRTCASRRSLPPGAAQ